MGHLTDFMITEENKTIGSYLFVLELESKTIKEKTYNFSYAAYLDFSVRKEKSVLIALIKLDYFTPEVSNTEGDREGIRSFLSKDLDSYTSLDAQKIDAFLWKKKKLHCISL